eukprot:3235865-Pyramimonas_sp.AAC.1
MARRMRAMLSIRWFPSLRIDDGCAMGHGLRWTANCLLRRAQVLRESSGANAHVECAIASTAGGS